MELTCRRNSTSCDIPSFTDLSSSTSASLCRNCKNGIESRKVEDYNLRTPRQNDVWNEKRAVLLLQEIEGTFLSRSAQRAAFSSAALRLCFSLPRNAFSSSISVLARERRIFSSSLNIAEKTLSSVSLALICWSFWSSTNHSWKWPALENRGCLLTSHSWDSLSASASFSLIRRFSSSLLAWKQGRIAGTLSWHRCLVVPMMLQEL